MDSSPASWTTSASWCPGSCSGNSHGHGLHQYYISQEFRWQLYEHVLHSDSCCIHTCMYLQGRHSASLQLQHTASLCNRNPGACVGSLLRLNIHPFVVIYIQYPSNTDWWWAVLKDGELLQDGDLQRACAARRPGVGREGQEEIGVQRGQQLPDRWIHAWRRCGIGLEWWG